MIDYKKEEVVVIELKSKDYDDISSHNKIILDSFITENGGDYKVYVINHYNGVTIAYKENDEYYYLNSKENKEFFTNNKVKLKSDLQKVFNSVKFEKETGLESSYDKARRLYPRLTEIEDGDYYCFWKYGDWMTYNITDLTHSGGSQCKIAKIEDLMKEDFVPEDLFPVLKKTDAYILNKEDYEKEQKEKEANYSKNK